MTRASAAQRQEDAMGMITRLQLNAVRMQAMDDAAVELSRTGAIMTHEQADAIDDVAMAWVRDRLDLHVCAGAEGVYLVPSGQTCPVCYDGEAEDEDTDGAL